MTILWVRDEIEPLESSQLPRGFGDLNFISPCRQSEVWSQNGSTKRPKCFCLLSSVTMTGDRQTVFDLVPQAYISQFTTLTLTNSCWPEWNRKWKWDLHPSFCSLALPLISSWPRSKNLRFWSTQDLGISPHKAILDWDNSVSKCYLVLAGP